MIASIYTDPMPQDLKGKGVDFFVENLSITWQTYKGQDYEQKSMTNDRTLSTELSTAWDCVVLR